MRPLAPALVIVVLAALPSTAAPPTYEIQWSRGGSSGPHELEAFVHPTRGPAVIAAGYAGGVTAVARGGPIWRWAEGNTQIVGIAAGDITGDGTADVVVGGYSNEVVLLDGVDGSVVARRGFNSAPEGLALGDADADGVEDLYVVTQGRAPKTNSAHLLSGKELAPVWSVDLGISQDFVLGSDAGDLDGDGRADLVFGTYANGPRLYAYGSDGAKRWEADLAGAVQNVAITGGSVLATRMGAMLYSIDPRTGGIRWSLPGAGFARLAAVELTGDGVTDAAWTLYGSSGKSALFQLMAVDGATGVPLWTRPTVAPAKALVAGDVDGDGDPDLAVTTQDVNTGLDAPNHVSAYEGRDGSPLWAHPLIGERTTYLSDVTLADVAGDTRPEVVAAPYSSVLLGLDGSDGAAVWSMPLGASVNSAAAADLDGDGAPETVEGSDDFRVTARRASTGTVLWTRGLGAQILRVGSVPAGTRDDVLAIALNVLYRLRGSDGSVVWSYPLQGIGNAFVLVPQQAGPALLAVGARARRTERAAGNNSTAGQLSVVDAATGALRWQVQTPGAPWMLEAVDVDADGARDLVAGMANNNLAVAVFDGAALGTAPVPLWQSASDGAVGGLMIAGPNLITARSTVNAVVAQDGATGVERWRRAMGKSTRLIGEGDVDRDGIPDALVATEIFAERLGAISGATGTVLFDVPGGVRFITAARWTDVSGDGAPDLVYASDGGTYGNGGVFAVDGTTLGGTEPSTLWSYPDVNAVSLVPVGEGFLAHGFPVRPDAITMLRPIPAAD